MVCRSVAFQGDILQFAVDDSCAVECRRGLSNLNGHDYERPNERCMKDRTRSPVSAIPAIVNRVKTSDSYLYLPGPKVWPQVCESPLHVVFRKRQDARGELSIRFCECDHDGLGENGSAADGQCCLCSRRYKCVGNAPRTKESKRTSKRRGNHT